MTEQEKLAELISEDLKLEKARMVAARLAGRDPLRQSGQTTRIVDRAIQRLFITGKVTIRDHHPAAEETDRAFKILCKRLNSEHPRVVFRQTGRHTIEVKYFDI